MKISVIIPVYNGAAYLAETLDSVLAQSCQPAEILVFDDGSTDDSLRIAQQYSGRARVVAKTNSGVSATRNLGAETASGEWIHFLDQDDVWTPDHLASQVEALLARPYADACYTGRRYLQQVSGTSSFILTPEARLPNANALRKHLLDRCPFTPSSVLLRKNAFLKAGGFDKNYGGTEDWDLWLRLTAAGATFVHAPASTLLYRVHSAANTNRPLPVLEQGKRVVRDDIMPALSPLARITQGQRVISRLEAEAAILLRENGMDGAVPLMLRSIARHPFHGPHRYKVFLHMLLKGYQKQPMATSA